MNYLTLIFPILLVIALVCFFFYYYETMSSGRLKSAIGWIQSYDKSPISFRLHKMSMKDLLPLCVILVVYGAVAFTNLGSNKAPETYHTFETTDPVVITFDEPTAISELVYYTGLHTGEYNIQYSRDGEFWFNILDSTDAILVPQHYDNLFKWLEIETNTPEIKYLRIIPTETPMCLGELVLKDENGSFISYTGADVLCDESDIVPEYSFWTNSTYFDEVYHPRTALEHLENVKPYEISHPPLGKLIIAFGISLFGMNPFGWRFMGTLFGVLMLIPFYILIKNMFGKTALAACGTVLFAFDFMHFVQTRIATIDTYGVMFIILSYLFMWRYACAITNVPPREKDSEGMVMADGGDEMLPKGQRVPGLLPLMLSVLFFGIGCASKWTVIYAGVGLAVIYAIAIVCRFKVLKNTGRKRSFAPFIFTTLAMSVLGFVAVPVVIYCLSYIPYGLAEGMTMPGMLLDGDYYRLVWDNQVYMLTYHQGVNQVHPYESRWWQWVLDMRPILYYLEYNGEVKSAFGCFNNPAVAWGGLAAVLCLPFAVIKRRNGSAVFVFIGYLAQLLPWVFITRTTFAYHYFPSTVFIVLALCFVFNDLMEKGKNKMVYAYTGVTTALFPLFYPVLTGIWTNTQWCIRFLKWLPTWPFG